MSTRTTEGWIKEYKIRQAYWLHDGNLKRPHVILRGEEHSNGFFNSRPVIKDEVVLRDAATDLLELFDQAAGDIEKVDLVVGPQTGATKLAEFLADQINGYLHCGDCGFLSPAKDERNGRRLMSFMQDELEILPGK